MLDEAYIEFADEGMKPGSIELFKEGSENLFILRTISKVYGLAGIRVGYGIGLKDLVSLMNRVKAPFDVSLIAESAGLVALSDQEFIKRTLKEAFREKEFFYRELKHFGLTYTASHTNFILIDTGFDSLKVFHCMLRRGIIVRPGRAIASKFRLGGDEYGGRVYFRIHLYFILSL